MGNAIAFVALLGAATWLQVSGHDPWPLWVTVVWWAVFGDFDSCDCSEGGE